MDGGISYRALVIGLLLAGLVFLGWSMATNDLIGGLVASGIALAVLLLGYMAVQARREESP